jgi:hypothetical protein
MSGDTNRLVFGRVIVIEVVDADGRLHPEQPWAFLGFAPEELCLAMDIDLCMLQASLLSAAVAWVEPYLVLLILITELQGSFKVEGRVDGGSQCGFLCREQVPDPFAESCFRDCHYVVAVHYRVKPESVGLPDWDLDGQAARGGGDWRDGDLRSLRDDHFSGKDQDRACLIQVRDVNGPH